MVDTLADAAAKNWQVRAVMWSGTNSTPENTALLLAVLKWSRRGNPKFADAGTLQADGVIWSILTPSTGAPRRIPVCTKDQFQSFLYAIVKGAKLTDEEGSRLYAIAQNWIDVDLTKGGTDLQPAAEGLKALRSH